MQMPGLGLRPFAAAATVCVCWYITYRLSLSTTRGCRYTVAGFPSRLNFRNMRRRGLNVRSKISCCRALRSMITNKGPQDAISAW